MSAKAAITVATTGPIATKQDNPHLPTTPEEIASAVYESYQAGASVAHIHVRDEDERPGLLSDQLQFSIVRGVQGGMAATADNLLNMVRRIPKGPIRQVIAIGRQNLELTAVGLALGGNARAGLEDTLYLARVSWPSAARHWCAERSTWRRHSGVRSRLSTTCRPLLG